MKKLLGLFIVLLGFFSVSAQQYRTDVALLDSTTHIIGYYGGSKMLYVRDSLTGGFFYLYQGALPANGVDIITGANSSKWRRMEPRIGLDKSDTTLFVKLGNNIIKFPRTGGGGGSQALQSVLSIGNQKSTSIIDTAVSALGRTGWYGRPANNGTSYGTYGTAGQFTALGWQQFNGVNPSGRPNVVGMFWGYNSEPNGGRIITSEPAFRFGTETFFEQSTYMFELHLPEFVDSAGVYHRLWSTYLDRTGKLPNVWQTEGDGIQLNKWGDQNTSYGYWGPGRITAFNYKRNQNWPYIEIGALADVDSVNGTPWNTKWNFKIQNVQAEVQIGRPTAVKADAAAIRFLDKIFLGTAGAANRRDFSQFGDMSISEGKITVDNSTGVGQIATFYYGGSRKFDIGTTFTEVVNDLYGYKGARFNDGVAIGASAGSFPSTGIVLDLKETAKTTLFPKLTTTTRNGLTAQTAMFHYNTDTGTLEYNDGAWKQIASREWVRAQGYSTGGGGGSSALQAVLAIGNEKSTTIVDTAISALGRTGWQGKPANNNVSYGTYGTAGQFGSLGWQQFNGVNPSGRPNVVGMFWAYNVNPDGSRIISGDGGFRFGTETHYETGPEKLFELHLPEFIDTAGVAHRLWSTYLDKTGKRPNLWQTEGDGIQLNKWGDQNTSYAYWGPGRITAFHYKKNQVWPYLELGALPGVDSVNMVPWDTKWNFKINVVKEEVQIGRPTAVKADFAAVRFLDKVFVGGSGVAGRRDYQQWGDFSLSEGKMAIDNSTGSGQILTLFYGGVRKFDVGTTFTEVVNTLYTYDNVLISNASKGIIVGGTSFVNDERIRANGDAIITGRVYIGAATSPNTAYINLAAGTTTRALMNFGTGVSPTSPAAGDFWYDATDTSFKYRVGSNNIAWKFSKDNVFSTGLLVKFGTGLTADTVGVGGGTSGQILVSTGASSFATWNSLKTVAGQSIIGTGDISGASAEASYTPTKTDVTNVGTSSVTVAQYQRVGDWVTVFGEITIDPTATGSTEVRLSIPIASGIANTYDLSGVASAGDVNQSIRILFEGGGALFRLNATDAASHVYSYSYRYKVTPP